MSLAVLNSCALIGMDAPDVQCEVHVSSGLPAFNIVGLPDAGIRESKERVRSALLSSGFNFPPGRITANLSPGNLRKESSRFDLVIAIGILLATRQLDLPEEKLRSWLPRVYFMGELSLTGALVPIKSSLVMALSIARRESDAILIMPSQSAREAALVERIRVLAANSLEEVCSHLCGALQLTEAQPQMPALEAADDVLCMSQVRGQPMAVRALQIAVCGRHNLLMEGPPGVGKSMLAQRLATILPELRQLERLEVAAIHSLSAQANTVVPNNTPYRSPHHSISKTALIGGGAKPQPGEVSLAHHGVLFMDEMPEFDRKALEALREPLENGYVNLSRVKAQQQYPAKFQLIGAMNPCPCGYHGHPSRMCECSAEQIRRYQSRISGPLLDRIDMRIRLRPLGANWLDAPPAPKSSLIRQEVKACQERQLARQGKLNGELSTAEVSEYCAMPDHVKAALAQQMQKHAWSGRVTDKIMKLARTIADLSESDLITLQHLAQAIAFKEAV